MKLATFWENRRLRWGRVEDEEVVDLSTRFPDLKSALEAGPEALGALENATDSSSRYPLSSITFAPVIPSPAKIVCVGHNYESHREETGRAKTRHPAIFPRFADSQVGAGQKLLRPKVSTMFDYEGELAVVIGRPGRYITPADALSHVAGYSCYNDASVRDWQWHTSQFLPGKTFPGTGAFGPWLVTADEIADPSSLRVTTRLNGTIVQDQPTSDMIFPVPEIIAYVSTFTSLSPGDVIVTGTPGGVGSKRDPPLWLKPDDVVEVCIPGVGRLVNAVADEP